MSDIDFQNGFLCGLAMKGLIKTGSQYEPNIWNDSGIYTYFYIDFKRALAPFSLGMLTESIIVYGDTQIPITGFEHVSGSVYKIFCNISNKAKGVLVFNRKSTLLTYTNGEKLPVFSTLFYVAGQVPYEALEYAYDTSEFQSISINSATDTESLSSYSITEIESPFDTTSYTIPYEDYAVIETASVVLA